MSRIELESRTRLGAKDYIVASVLGVLAFVAFGALSLPGLDPAQWEETAVAAQLIPPRDVFPGFWRILASLIFSALGFSKALHVLSVSGAVVGGVIVALTYVLVCRLLRGLAQSAGDFKVWNGFISTFFAAIAAVLVAVADPVWRMVQTFSPECLMLFMLLAAVNMWLKWLGQGGTWRLYAIVALMGLLAAETPFAFVFCFVFLFGYFRLWRHVVDGYSRAPDALVDPECLPRWRMFFLFWGALGLGVWLNASIFARLGGVDANGWDLADLYFRYGFCYLRSLGSAASWLGWVLGLGFSIIPLFVVFHLFPEAVSDERQMEFRKGVILVFMFILAALQTGAFPVATFWIQVRTGAAVSSGFLLGIFVLCEALVVTLVGAAFTFECQRVYLREEDERPGIKLRALVPVLAVALCALAAVRLPRPVEIEMKKIVRDALEETLVECEGAKWLFTDGHLDNPLRLMAAAKGQDLKPLNMMSGEGRWESSVRMSNFPYGSADRDVAATGIPLLLRTWCCEKPNGMDEAALQLGFELWKRENKPMPTVSGFVAREKGFDGEAVKRGAAAAEKLAERILELSPRLKDAHPSNLLMDAFSSVSWRISRLARMRNNEDLADKLDAANTALKRLLTLVEYERQRTFMQLTPWEGLLLALRRADFVEAMRLAPAVLRMDPENPEANFGMGMGFLKDNKYEDAKTYLERCLVRRPDEPVVMNNLSIICRKLKMYDEALDYAKRAIILLPDSPEVKQTLQDATDKAP